MQWGVCGQVSGWINVAPAKATSSQVGTSDNLDPVTTFVAMSLYLVEYAVGRKAS